MLDIPEFEDYGLTLLLFNDPEGHPIARAWHMLQECATLTLVTGQGDLVSERICSLQDFSSVMCEAATRYPGVLNSTLYSVHPSGVFGPLYRWARARSLDMPSVSNVHDLCELFYRPAFVTFDERLAFGPQTIRNVLGDMGTASDNQLMYEACQKLITVD